MELNHLSVVRRPKTMTEKFKNLQDLCEAFDNFSESERKLNLFKYLGVFARRDAIPDQYNGDPGPGFLVILKLYLNKNFHVREYLLFTSEIARSADSEAIFGFKIEER